MANIIPMFMQMKENGESDMYTIFKQYQIASQDHMWFKTNISEEELNISIELLNLSEDPEFIEKVRRHNLQIIDANSEFEK
jgi:hypothetical protein